MFVIQIKKLAFVNMSIYNVSLIDVRLFNLFMRVFIFNRVTIANVNSYNIAS